MVDTGEAAGVRFRVRRFPITLNQSGKVLSIRPKALHPSDYVQHGGVTRSIKSIPGSSIQGVWASLAFLRTPRSAAVVVASWCKL